MNPHAPVGDDDLRATLIRQYGAALAMLRSAVEGCPEDAWSSPSSDDGGTWVEGAAPDGWQLAYHALFYTHLYLMPAEADFVPWDGHVHGTQNDDGLSGPPRDGDARPLLPPPYAKGEVLSYLDWIRERLDAWIAHLDLASGESGFSWYPIPKLDHQFVNVRHLQHHAAQLMRHVRDAGGDPGGWRAADPMPPR